MREQRGDSIWYRVSIVAIAIAIFVLDTFTAYEVAVAVLYVAVVLMSARLLQKRGVTLVAAGCIALTLVSSLISYLANSEPGSAFHGIANTLISITAIVVTAALVVRIQGADTIEALNKELTNRSAALEASNKELEAFAYSISHDLRAPLRHMSGFAELLRKNASASLDEKSHRYLTTILEAAKRMGTLIDELLAFSRIGRTEANRSVVSLEQLVQEAVSEARLDAKDRQIVWKISALPGCYGDRAMLRLVFVNLIANAVKFSRTRARAEIEVGCADGRSDELVLFVRDNGVGFDMKYSNKLFGVFQRLHPLEAFEGTGIGLATVQRIIHRHGGRVWAEATVNGGATFYFSLPKTTRS